MGKKYIGVDLGAWYGNKTRIAVCEVNKDNKLMLKKIEKEPTSKKEDYTKRDEDLKDYEIKNKSLINFLLKEKGSTQTVIAIDAPFAIPSYLSNSLEDEKLYNPKDTIKGELANPFIFDNSARFVFKETNQRVLPPAGDKIGRLTARMIHIIDKYDKLNFIREPKDLEEGISIIEVFPTATIFKLAQAQDCLSKYFKTENNTEKYDENKKLEIKSYKGDYFQGKKGKESQKAKMLELIKPYIIITNDQKEDIKSDDDYDAIICALTAYLVSQKDGYLKPEDIDKFTNSFIYMPDI